MPGHRLLQPRSARSQFIPNPISHAGTGSVGHSSSAKRLAFWLSGASKKRLFVDCLLRRLTRIVALMGLDSPRLIGRSVSHFRIVEKLGSGGMVRRATKRRTGQLGTRFVALKFLPDGHRQHSQALELRFQRGECQGSPRACSNHPTYRSHLAKLANPTRTFHGHGVSRAASSLKARHLRICLPCSRLKPFPSRAISIADALDAAHFKASSIGVHQVRANSFLLRHFPRR